MYKYLNQEFLKLLKKLQIIKVPHNKEILKIDAGYFGIFQKLAIWYGMYIFIWFTLYLIGFSNTCPTWGMLYLFIALWVINAIYIGFKGNELIAKHYFKQGYTFVSKDKINE